MRKIELINLTLDEIRRSAMMVSDVYIDSVHSNNKEEHYIFKSNIKLCDEALENCRVKLRDALEEIAEFQNAKDMVCPVDAALTEVSFDLIYERKTEGDYDAFDMQAPMLDIDLAKDYPIGTYGILDVDGVPTKVEVEVSDGTCDGCVLSNRCNMLSVRCDQDREDKTDIVFKAIDSKQ